MNVGTEGAIIAQTRKLWIRDYQNESKNSNNSWLCNRTFKRAFIISFSYKPASICSTTFLLVYASQSRHV